MTAACAKMDKLGGDIQKDIAAWEFTRCSFIKLPKDKADPEVLSVAKVIENANQNFDQWSASVVELASKQAHQPESIKEKVASIKAAFDSNTYQNMLTHSSIILAHCSLASAVYNSATPADRTTWPRAAAKMLAHARSNLNVKDEWLDREFMAIITSDTKDSGQQQPKPKATARLSSGSSSSSASAIGGSTASSTASTASPVAATAPRQPGTKFRRK